MCLCVLFCRSHKHRSSSTSKHRRDDGHKSSRSKGDLGATKTRDSPGHGSKRLTDGEQTQLPNPVPETSAEALDKSKAQPETVVANEGNGKERLASPVDLAAHQPTSTSQQLSSGVRSGSGHLG